MRGVFQRTVTELVKQRQDLVLLLGDIGVYGFRDLQHSFPERALNIGILEQTMTSFAAGLALDNKIPILHSITPFLIERAFEQIKVDFGYQSLGGKFISVGGSFDYSKLGATHHCPEDVSLLLTIPGFEIFLPANSIELEEMLRAHIGRKSLSYFRLEEQEFVHTDIQRTEAGVSLIAGSGRNQSHLILAAGSAIRQGHFSANELGLDLVYINEISSRSLSKLSKIIEGSTYEVISVIQPFYEGTLAHLISGIPMEHGRGARVHDVGVPRSFITSYGETSEIERLLGLDEDSVTQRIRDFQRG